MFQLLAVLCLAVAAMAMPYNQALDSEWLAFKQTHKKNYTADEETLRYVRFQGEGLHIYFSFV